MLPLPWPQKVKKGRGRAPSERGMETRCLFRAGRLSRVSWRHRCLSGSSRQLPWPIRPQGPFRHFLDMKAEERLASWKERRSRYGDINMHKCYPLGQVFTPFRALATTVSKLVFETGFQAL